jgi:hypothetical protein
MAIATGVVGDPLVSALITCLDVPTQSRGAAASEVIEDASLLGRERIAKLVEERGATASDDIG